MDSTWVERLKANLSAATPDEPHPVEIAGLLTLIAVAAFVFLAYDAGDHRRWWALSLLFLFTFVVTRNPRRSPLLWNHLRLALLMAIVVALLLLGVDPFAAVVLFFVLSAEALQVLPRQHGYLWPFICGLVTIESIAYITQDLMLSIFVGLGALGGYLFVGSATESRKRADEANRASQQLLADLRAANHQLQLYAAQVEELAVANERNHLAREMHDTLGHRLTVAAVQLEGAQRLIGRDTDKAMSMVGTVRLQILEGLAELRATVARLRTPLEVDLRLPTALTRLTSGFGRATGLEVHLSLPAELPDLPESHRHALYRAAQEALTNAQKYSHATTLWMTVALPDAGSISLSVEDDGIGIAQEKLLNGYGLRGMSERADQLNGSMRVESHGARGGATVAITLPLAGQPMPALLVGEPYG